MASLGDVLIQMLPSGTIIPDVAIKASRPWASASFSAYYSPGVAQTQGVRILKANSLRKSAYIVNASASVGAYLCLDSSVDFSTAFRMIPPNGNSAPVSHNVLPAGDIYAFWNGVPPLSGAVLLVTEFF